VGQVEFVGHRAHDRGRYEASLAKSLTRASRAPRLIRGWRFKAGERDRALLSAPLAERHRKHP
jgi:hypothetical protein